jgi:hypothetical protein
LLFLYSRGIVRGNAMSISRFSPVEFINAGKAAMQSTCKVQYLRYLLKPRLEK